MRMRASRRGFGSLVALGLLVPPAWAFGQDPGDAQNIQGTWQLVYAETDGKPTPADQVRKLHVVFRTNDYTVLFDGEEVLRDVAYTLDPSASPKTSVSTIPSGPDQGKQIRGIYRLEGDTLTSCFGTPDGDRPAEFDTAPARGHTLHVFKKVVEGEGPEQAALREELIRLGGVWTYGPGQADGVPVRPDQKAGARLKIKGDRFEQFDPETGTERGVFRIDPTKRPKTVEITYTDGPLKGRLLRGIYELDGNVYRIAVSLGDTDPPTELKAEAGSGHAVQEMRRIEP